jgi:uncharacterized membrane protein
MDKLTSKKELLDVIRLAEGADFICDEQAILEEYNALGENTSSLPIKVLSIFGSFLATLAFLGFLLIAELYDTEIGILLLGIGFLSSSIFLNKRYDKLIIDTFSISLYVTGFALFAFALADMKVDENIIALLNCLIAFSSLIITQNFILPFISILTMSGSIIFLICANDANDLIHLYITAYTVGLAYIFLHEGNIISSSNRLSKLYNPLRIGIIFSLLFGLISIGKRHLIPITQEYIWISSIVIISVILYVVSIIIKMNEISSTKSKVVIYVLSSLTLLLTIFSPSISGAILILLLSFLVNYKSGFVIGIISIIYFISQYYYDLNLTLLTKSLLLCSSGILFLLFYIFIIKNVRADEKI